MKFSKLFIIVVLLMFAPAVWADIVLDEGFDNIATLPGSGWALLNNSSPLGVTGWFQGNSGVFPAYQGADDSYIAANFLNADVGGNISNWLLTPEVPIDGVVEITFYTRTETDSLIPDSLELRLSENGASTDVGATDTSVGDFGFLLLTINPALMVSGYPEDWTRVSAVISGLPSGTMGRFALRYFVPDTLDNGNYIGIDSVQISHVVPEPESLALVGSGILMLAFCCRRFRF
jgi:hypothetical protein